MPLLVCILNHVVAAASRLHRSSYRLFSILRRCGLRFVLHLYIYMFSYIVIAGVHYFLRVYVLVLPSSVIVSRDHIRWLAFSKELDVTYCAVTSDLA
jgi:hypothetical protein